MKDRIFLIDFDRTLTDKDTTDSIMGRYNYRLLEETRQKIRQGEIDIKGYLKTLLESLEIGEEEYINEISTGITIDPFFKKFLSLGEGVRIVSAGTYHNVLSNFKKAGIDFPEKLIYSNRLSFENGKIKVVVPDMESFEGICKKKVVEKYKEDYKEVIFIGDGWSDYQGASAAHKIFAKKGLRLEKFCLENELDYRSYENFEEIINIYNIQEGKGCL